MCTCILVCQEFTKLVEMAELLLMKDFTHPAALDYKIMLTLRVQPDLNSNIKTQASLS